VQIKLRSIEHTLLPLVKQVQAARAVLPPRFSV